MSIPVTEKLVNESSGVDTTFGFSAKVENLGVLFHILRNQLYSDPIMAVLREYSCNAYDANISIGKKDTQVVVTLPTMMDSFLKIRDFGPGLNDQNVQEIFCSYGESTKRNTNLQTGMLGIGCKSGFAYTDSFLVHSYQDGKLTVWNCFIDKTNTGAMSKMTELETTEPNGIQVVIPVKTLDINKFREKALNLFTYFDIVPKFENLSVSDLSILEANRNVKSQFSGDDWKYTGGGRSVAIMGNIAYPLDPNIFVDGEIRPEMRQLLSQGLIIKFKMNELEFAASRETLQYTPTTKKKLISKLTDIFNELSKQASKVFSDCKTLWQAKLMYSKVFDMHGQLYSLRGLFSNVVKFKGANINTHGFTTQFQGVTNSFYHKPGGYARVRRQDSYEIAPGEKVLVVINDKDIVNGIINRLVGQMEAGPKYEKIYVLKFTDNATKQLWLQDSKFDGPTIDLSSLPKEPLSKYYTNLAGGSGSFVNPKNYAKEFEWNGDSVSRYSNRSDFWHKIDVDIDKDAGVWLEIDRYEYRTHNNYLAYPADIKDILAKIKGLGIAVPQILGLKNASMAKAKNNPKMVNFWKWLELELEKYLKANPLITEGLMHRQYIANSSDMNGMKELADIILKWKSTIGQSPLVDFCTKVKKFASFDETSLARISELTGLTNYRLVSNLAWNPSQELTKMTARYPMLFLISKHAGVWKLGTPEYSVGCKDYVVLVDASTP